MWGERMKAAYRDAIRRRSARGRQRLRWLHCIKKETKKAEVKNETKWIFFRESEPK